MKKFLFLLLPALLAGSLLTGCRRNTLMPPETTVPHATVPTATRDPHPATEPMGRSLLPERATDATIEDGNGPIPSQIFPRG